MKSELIIKFTMPGFHRYPDAPAEVDFLSDRHRHIFVFEVIVPVHELNREREFFTLIIAFQKFLKKKYGDPCEFKGMSCEMIAEKFLKHFKFVSSVLVSEDGENGARVTR